MDMYLLAKSWPIVLFSANGTSLTEQVKDHRGAVVILLEHYLKGKNTCNRLSQQDVNLTLFLSGHQYMYCGGPH